MDTGADARRDLGRELHADQDRDPRPLAGDGRLGAGRARRADAGRAALMRAARWRASAVGCRPDPARRDPGRGAVPADRRRRAGDLLLARRASWSARRRCSRPCSRSGSTRRSAPEACASPGYCSGWSGSLFLLGVDLGGDGSRLLGGLAVVLAGLGYAVGGFMVKRRLVEGPPIGIVAWVDDHEHGLARCRLPWTAFPRQRRAGPLLAVVLLGVLGTGVAFVDPLST